jgi:hypothetical protein
MVASAYFASAPTVRFLRTVDQLRLLPSDERQKIATAVFTKIKPHIGSSDLSELRAAARVVQDERWRMISGGPCKMTEVRFAGVVLIEQWLLAHVEMVRAAAPIAEVLAEKRRDAIEEFIRDNLYVDSGEVIALHAHASAQHQDRDSSKTAA